MRPWEVPYSERFKDRLPRICIGVVAFGDIDASVYESSMAWALSAGKRYAGKFEIFFTVANRKEQYRARNQLVRDAMQTGADFLVMLDDDHPLADCMDFLGHFYRAEKPFQGGLYLQRSNDITVPVIMKFNRATGEADFYKPSEVPTQSGPVDILGGGINWYDMGLFDFMSEPIYWPLAERTCWFKPHQRYGLDLFFSLRVREQLGVEPWLNLNVQMGHVISERQIIRPETIQGNARCPYCDGLMSPIEGGLYACNACERQMEAFDSRSAAAFFSNREKYRPAYEKLGDSIVKHFPKCKLVYDAGSGQGFLVDALVKRGLGVIGVEKEFEAALPYMSVESRCRIFKGDITEPSVSPEQFGRFDLVTCVEVAEHIPAEDADKLVQHLCDQADQHILFTADATDTENPHHVNCQPSTYWIDKFEKRGWHFNAPLTFCMAPDFEHEAAPWIARNLLVFSKEKRDGSTKVS